VFCCIESILQFALHLCSRLFSLHLHCFPAVVSSTWISQVSPAPLCIGFDYSIPTGGPQGKVLMYVGNTVSGRHTEEP
jgi:hypothetical protein